VQRHPDISAGELRRLVWADDPNGGPEDRKCLHVHVSQLNHLLAVHGIMVRSRRVSHSERVMSRAHPEQQLQRSVLAHLGRRGMPGLWYCHIPNGGYRNAIEAAIFKSLGVVAGAPDLLLIYGGRTYGLELKAAKGKLSPTQIVTHERMKAAGAIVATATGIDEALGWLTLWGLIKREPEFV
jgi:hypothetical protein